LGRKGRAEVGAEVGTERGQIGGANARQRAYSRAKGGAEGVHRDREERRAGGGVRAGQKERRAGGGVRAGQKVGQRPGLIGGRGEQPFIMYTVSLYFQGVLTTAFSADFSEVPTGFRVGLPTTIIWTKDHMDISTGTLFRGLAIRHRVQRELYRFVRMVFCRVSTYKCVFHEKLKVQIIT
jgi:hypothetical protein